MPDPLQELTAAGVSVWLDDLSRPLPQATLAAVANHGSIRGDTIRLFYTDARQVLRDIAAVGVDYDDVMGLLEADGIAKFESSWALVSAELGDRLRATSSASQRSHIAASR